MKLFTNILWRIKFLLLDSWGMSPDVVLATIMPFQGKVDLRENVLGKRGILVRDRNARTLNYQGLTLHYGNSTPLSDIISIALYNESFVHRNIVRNPMYYFDGPYESGPVTIEPGDTVVDAGANIGVFTLFASKKVGETGTVLACEPIAESLELLKKNIAANKLTNVTVVPYALGDVVKKVRFSMSDTLRGSSGVLTREGKSVEVEQVTLDSYLGGKDVHFIKSDIEGMERYLLKGAEQTIRRCKPKLSICTYHLPDDLEVIESIIRSFVPEYEIIKTETKILAYIPKK